MIPYNQMLYCDIDEIQVWLCTQSNQKESVISKDKSYTQLNISIWHVSQKTDKTAFNLN